MWLNFFFKWLMYPLYHYYEGCYLAEIGGPIGQYTKLHLPGGGGGYPYGAPLPMGPGGGGGAINGMGFPDWTGGGG